MEREIQAIAKKEPQEVVDALEDKLEVGLWCQVQGGGSGRWVCGQVAVLLRSSHGAGNRGVAGGAEVGR